MNNTCPEMEGPISKFMHVQQPDSYWHQSSSTSAFKSPDLIELNSDTERNAKPVEPTNYSSSQEEAETEDDGCEHVERKEGLAGVYDVTSNDEESCHLLQTEDDSDGSHSEHGWDSSDSGSSRSSSSNGGTMSDGEGTEERKSKRKKNSQTENYWDMTPEQEKYYTDQFFTLQVDGNGLVSGAVAKGFFEKSKLPLTELREIWQLADVTRDGCLDLNEFKMAMHLVVLRRHGLGIPSHFYLRQAEHPLGQPVTTGPSALFKIGGSVGGGHHTKKSKSRSNDGHAQQSPPIIPSLSNTASTSQSKRPSKEWTTFENEPVNFSSTCDTSGLVAPVPVRLKTPEDKLFLNSSLSSSASKTHQLQLKAIQRPKLSGHHPKVSSGIAPPPPPRRKTHVRSSSLDLNRLTISSEMPHTVNGTLTTEVTSRNFLSPSHQGGAFSVYRKPQLLSRTATIHEPEASTISGTSSIIDSNNTSNSSSRVQIEQELCDLKKENDVLNRVSAQLLEQLSGVQARRQTVAQKIHHLHSNRTLS